MTEKEEIKRLRRLLRRYRRLVERLIDEALDYVNHEECCFCSGYKDHKPSHDSRSGKIVHSRKCPTRKAEELRAVEI